MRPTNATTRPATTSRAMVAPERRGFGWPWPLVDTPGPVGGGPHWGAPTPGA